MSALQITDEELVSAWQKNPSVARLLSILKGRISERRLRQRVRDLRKAGVKLPSRDSRSPAFDRTRWESIREARVNYDARIDVSIESGTIIVGSDAHFWPGDRSTAFRAFIKFIREMRPRIVVVNGDMFDGATISRWPRIGWDRRPTVLDELKVCKERLTEIEDASGNAARYWPLGNHDGRWERRLAMVAPEYEGVKYFSLKDHFPTWKPCWSVMVNRNTLIKHKWKGGRYAVANNALHSGVSMVTGHLHALKWWPHTDEGPLGTRYGVDTGCLADVGGKQFIDYTEDGVKDWRSGFAVLTYHKGDLLQPELVKVREEGAVDFRGKVYEV